MSSSPTARTSTTASSTGSPSRPDPAAERVAVVVCGAIARPVGEVAARRGWPVDIHPLPPLLHNRPQRIAAEVERLVGALAPRYRRVAVGYADCGTYGELDAVCARLGVPRLPGGHCYDVLAGPDRVRALLDGEPGTYLLTDFLATSFERTVVAELGLDRYPELAADYFGHYRRVVWLAQDPTPARRAAAQAAATRLGLPLEIVPVGDGGLERALAEIVGAVSGSNSADPG